MSVSRRGFALVRDGKIVARAPATSRKGEVEQVVADPTRPEGWYRCSLTYWRGSTWSVRLAKKIDPSKEAKRLAEMGNRVANARTGSPGITGYQQREDASRRAAAHRLEESRKLATMLADWSAERSAK